MSGLKSIYVNEMGPLCIVVVRQRYTLPIPEIYDILKTDLITLMLLPNLLGPRRCGSNKFDTCIYDIIYELISFCEIDLSVTEWHRSTLMPSGNKPFPELM